MHWTGKPLGSNYSSHIIYSSAPCQRGCWVLSLPWFVNTIMNNHVNSSVNKESKSPKKTLRNWIIAGSLLLTLWTQAAENKPINNEINTTNIENTYWMENSLSIEEVEKLKVTDYLTLIDQKWNVYYPEYWDYLSKLVNLGKQFKSNTVKNIFNIILGETINDPAFKPKIRTEKQIITTALYALDWLTNEKRFLNNESIKTPDNEYWEDTKRVVWKMAAREIWKKIIDINQKTKISLNKIENCWLSDLPPEEFIKWVEECIMNTYSIDDLKYSFEAQALMELYISTVNRLWKPVSQRWRQRIQEYEKITQ